MLLQRRFLLVVITLLLAGCDGKRDAIGKDNKITVIVPQPHAEAALDALTIIFDDTLYTPQPELEYFMATVNISEFNRYCTHVNAVVVGLGTDESDPGNILVKQLLPAQSYSDAKSGGQAIFVSHDPYAREQVFLILCARDEEQLQRELKKNRDWLKKQYDDNFAVRQGEYLFHEARQSTIEDKIFNKYGWGILVPWGYVVIQDSPDSNFFWMGRDLPFRWVSVQWSPDLIELDETGAIATAQAYADSLYGNVRFSDYRIKARQVDFRHWSAWRITGLWEELEKPQGGPFIHYIFYDGVTNRTYQINTLIFFPGEEKIILMRQLDLIAHSFFVEKPHL